MLLYKRFEQGRFQWLRTAEQVRELSAQQYRWLMEGLVIEQPNALKPCGNMLLD